MSVLLLTRPDDRYPFNQSLYVDAREAVCEFGLVGAEGSSIEVERCLLADAPQLLDRFLQRLTTDEPVDTTGADAAEIWTAQIDWLSAQTGMTGAAGMVDTIRSVRETWQHLAVPLASARSLAFVKSAEPPSAVRSSIQLRPTNDGWTLAFVSSVPGDDIDVLDVSLHLQPELLHELMSRLTA